MDTATWIDSLGWFGFLATLSVVGCLPGAIARSRGHGFVAWWILGGLFFPLALPIVICLERNDPGLRRQATRHDGRRICPFCLEAIAFEATICRYCRCESDPLVDDAAVDDSTWWDRQPRWLQVQIVLTAGLLLVLLILILTR